MRNDRELSGLFDCIRHIERGTSRRNEDHAATNLLSGLPLDREIGRDD
jgi:hypothetical protein